MRKLADLCKKAGAGLLGSSMLLSMLPVPIQAAVPAQLENRASEYTVDVPSSENGKGAENLTDGDDSTLWVNNGAKWPCTLTFYPPAEMPTIYKAVVRFEKGQAARSMDVELSHVNSNVVTDPITDKTADDWGFGNAFEVVWEDGIAPTSLSLTLSDPKTNGAAGAFWPGLAEVEFYSEKESEQPAGELVNVAPRGTVSASSDIPEANNGPDNLIDENYGSLYVFQKGLTSNSNPWVQVTLDQEYEVSSIEAAVENKDPDPSNFEYTFNVLGKAAGSDTWTTLQENVKATRLNGNNRQTIEFDAPVKLKDVRLSLVSLTGTAGDPWPAFAELKVFARTENQGGETADGNILKDAIIHTSSNQADTGRLIDGSLNTVWQSEIYPAYIDFDLKENYLLDEAIVYTPAAGYSQYTIYTSVDGKNFSRAARKTSKDACTNAGETWPLEKTEARYIRLYIEYNSNNVKAQVRDFVVHGQKAGTETVPFTEPAVKDFKDTEYAANVTEQDTIDEVRGIITRRLGSQYNDWFTFELAQSANGYDYYDVSAKDGKIHIKGNDGVSLATGLNAWLKECAKINISQVSEQTKMPESIVLPEKTMHKETRFHVRYAYNFCTLSYSMAFWGEKEWRDELDWLALNGANVVLDATGEEEVWRRFLSECGYSYQEIKDFLVGPAYVGWFYMANMTGFGGPLPDSWFEQRTDLARKNHRIMQVLGMQPVLQGYCGMVPVDFQSKQPDAKVIPQGRWNQFQRPYMLKTDDEATFNKYAKMFYKHQQDVFGDVTDYYATDPFHEGGNTGGMNAATIASQTVDLMVESDPDAVWIIQAWQGNPSAGLMSGLEGKREHALVLDLYADRQPHWEDSNYAGGKEFSNTPWLYCMLNNFGGRLGLYGQLDTMNEQIPHAANTANRMAGIGITPEADQNNPLLYEFFFDSIWTEDASVPLEKINLDQWLIDYAQRRYGAVSVNAQEALNILADTVYSVKYNPAYSGGQGAPENVVNARPALSIAAASTWGYSTISYDKKELEKALKLMLEDYDLLKDSAGYQYDLVNIAQQVLSNTAQEYLSKMNAANTAQNLEEFTVWSDKFLELIDTSDQLLSTQKYFLLGNWTEAAGRMVVNPDDFTADLLDVNAKALITTWGSIQNCNSGGLKDYSNRQWAGLTSDFYKKRWQLFIDEKKKELSGQSSHSYSAADWFEFEWAWVRDHSKTYTDTPAALDTKALAQNVLDHYSVRGLNPAADDERDLEKERMTAAAGSEETSEGENADKALDGDLSTMWHSKYQNTDRSTLWYELTLDSPAMVDGLRYLPRPSGVNGNITGYKIDIQAPDSTEWKTVATGSWANNNSWKYASFDPTEAVKVRIYATNSAGDNARNIFASATEFRLTGTWSETPAPAELDLSLLEAVAAKAGQLEADAFVKDTAWDTAADKLKEASDVLADPKDQDQVNTAAAKLNMALLALRRTPTKDALEAI